LSLIFWLIGYRPSGAWLGAWLVYGIIVLYLAGVIWADKIDELKRRVQKLEDRIEDLETRIHAGEKHEYTRSGTGSRSRRGWHCWGKP